MIDRRWRDHLYEMDYLKDGIGLRAMAQRDPLVEYQREGFAMFQQMMGPIREESVGFLFNLEVEVAAAEGEGDRPPRSRRRASARRRSRPAAAATRPPSDAGEVEVRNQRGQVAAGGDQPAAPGCGTHRSRRRPGGRGAARSVRPADRCRRTGRRAAEPRRAPGRRQEEVARQRVPQS